MCNIPGREPSQAELVHYPAGALLRVGQICRQPAKAAQPAGGPRDRKRPKPASPEVPGLLPIVGRTWLSWVEQGKVPPGQKLGPRTRVWPIETVLAAAAANLVDAE